MNSLINLYMCNFYLTCMTDMKLQVLLSDLHDRYETPSVYLKHFFIMEERKRPNNNVRKDSRLTGDPFS
jgi:hypothetical protein